LSAHTRVHAHAFASTQYVNRYVNSIFCLHCLFLTPTCVSSCSPTARVRAFDTLVYTLRALPTPTHTPSIPRRCPPRTFQHPRVHFQHPRVRHRQPLLTRAGVPRAHRRRARGATQAQEAWDSREGVRHSVQGIGTETGAQMCLTHARQTSCSVHTLDTHARTALLVDRINRI
jgi:hypothetical protein